MSPDQNKIDYDLFHLSRIIIKKYGYKRCTTDIIEVGLKKFREEFLGFDYSIFNKSIQFFNEELGISLTKEDALRCALDKKSHKNAWFLKERRTLKDKMDFYKETYIYPFRQPFLKRFGGFHWYINLIKHKKNPIILEYGCGSAILTEYLIERYPLLKYTVADIPSVTLDFVKWKKNVFNYKYAIKTVGIGKNGIPLSEIYDLIICQDVLEHTPNPLDIVEKFVDCLSPYGVLVIDFLNAPGGENLIESAAERSAVIEYLKLNLFPIKEIDQYGTNYGLYIKPNRILK